MLLVCKVLLFGTGSLSRPQQPITRLPVTVYEDERPSDAEVINPDASPLTGMACLRRV